MSMKKMLWTSLIALPVGLALNCYTTFVLQNLWNWFVIPAFHVSVIDFWVMYGLVLMVSLLFEHMGASSDEHRWRTLFAVLGACAEACVPEEKRQDTEEALRAVLRAETSLAWIDTGSAAVGKVMGATLTLAVGWGIHVFLGLA